MLFFVRLFADVAGRMLPRIKSLALRSSAPLLGLALGVTAAMPLFFVYLKAPARYHNDYGIVGACAGLAGCPVSRLTGWLAVCLSVCLSVCQG